ncbi:MAG: LytR C-terminal domain-containing protein [Burkholderiaceae bacterium]|nr:LytR C-terminal domain-containing protein [Burkholderiaceae bacterium]
MNPCHSRLRSNALTVAAMAVVLAGCSTPEPKSWRVAPNYRISHAGPSADAGYVALARQFEGERRWREARDAWRKAALAAPQDADILNALGLAEASQGQYGHAVAALRRAVALAPERAQLLNNLGYALLLDGHSVEAKSVLQEALARSPDHLLARANLERIDQVAGVVPSLATLPKDAPQEASTRAPQLQTLQTAPNVEALQLRQAGLSAASEAPQVKAAVVAAPNSLAAEVPVRAAEPPPPRVEIVNGNGVTGMAASLSGWLRARGLAQHTLLSNAQPFNTMTTVMHYRTGYFTVAKALAERMPYRVEVATEPGGALNADVRVVLGRDLRAAGEPVKRTPVQAKSTLKPGWPAG